MAKISSHALDPVRPGEIVFRVHGPRDGAPHRVLASVFADKLATLVRALKAADKAANGVVMHDYAIEKLQSSSPTAVLLEEPLPKYEGQFETSAIPYFTDCTEAIAMGNRERALRYGKCAYQVQRLAKGAPNKFGYGEIWTQKDTIIRVDDFLRERASAIVTPEKAIVPRIESRPPTSEWFKGTAHGSFEGEVLEVDFRGSLPALKLILTAGGKEIDCVCNEGQLEQIRSALKRRARVFGQAFYDGKSGLPRRIIVTDIEVLHGEADFTKWRGAFEPFDPVEWEGDDT